MEIKFVTTTKSVYINVRKFIGIEGEKGDMGPKGERGLSGEVGTPGIEGPEGQKVSRVHHWKNICYNHLSKILFNLVLEYIMRPLRYVPASCLYLPRSNYTFQF